MSTIEWTLRDRPKDSAYAACWELKDAEYRDLSGLKSKVLYGYLLQGAKRAPGWYVTQYVLSVPFARLSPNLSLEEAQNAAKMLLTTGRNL